MTDYYVNTVTGNDTTGTGAISAPWKSLQKAWSATVDAGPNNVYCSGGIDKLTAILNGSACTHTNGIVIIGDYTSGTNPSAHTGYKLVGRDTGGIQAISINNASKTITLKNLYCLANVARTTQVQTNFEGLIHGYVTSGTAYFYAENCVFEYTSAAALSGGSYSHGNVVIRSNGGSLIGHIANSYFIASGSNPTQLNFVYITPAAAGDFKVVNCLVNTQLPGGLWCGKAGIWGGAGGGSERLNVYGCSIISQIGSVNSAFCATLYCNIVSGCVWNNGSNWNLSQTNCAQDAALASYFIDNLSNNFTPDDTVTAPASISNRAPARPNQTTVDISGWPRPVLAEDVQGWDVGPWEYALRSPFAGTHTVTDISQITDPDCIYYGQSVDSRAIQVGDKVSFKQTTETNAWSVSIDSQGFPAIDSGGATGSDSFHFNMSAGTSGIWEPTPPAYATWIFTIAVQDPDITTTALGAMTDQTAFSQTLAATGTTPITWSVSAGILPPGLSLSSAGVLSGTLAGYGAYDFTALATNSINTDTQQYTGTIAALAPTVFTSSLPTAYNNGTAYAYQLAATGSTPVTWSLTGGTLPTGITLSSSGLLSGSTTVPAATFSPQVTVTNTAGSNAKTLSLIVAEGAQPPTGPGNALGGIPLYSTGQWYIDAGPIDHYNQGYPISAAGAMVCSAAVPVSHWLNGFPRTEDSMVAIDSVAARATSLHGIPLTAAGKIAVANASVAYYSGGIPFTSTGRVAVSTLV